MNAINSIPTLETSHYFNLVARFVGCAGKRLRTEGELGLSEVLPFTSKDYFGVADPSALQDLGNRLGNHPMRQAVNLVESAGPDGSIVAVSATNTPSE
jgi:hypothetical protein